MRWIHESQISKLFFESYSATRLYIVETRGRSTDCADTPRLNNVSDLVALYTNWASISSQHGAPARAGARGRTMPAPAMQSAGHLVILFNLFAPFFTIFVPAQRTGRS